MADLDYPAPKKIRQDGIPPELSFEEVIKNRTASPCSLSDFMDYLVYIERSAENLQFFLWYIDYVQRWSSLLPRQKALSPPWNPPPDHHDSPDPDSPLSSKASPTHHRSRERSSEKLTKILAIMDLDSERNGLFSSSSSSSSRTNLDSNDPPTPFSPPPPPVALRSPTTPKSITSSSSLTTSLLSPTELTSPKPDWQPFTIPPNQLEHARIMRHYLSSSSSSPSSSSPRRLPSLPPQDRSACLLAAQHTTHPSSLLPAFAFVESRLRQRSHPAFIRWSLRNASAARLALVRLLAAAVVVAGLVADCLLIMSRLAVGWRVVCLVFWWPGLAGWVAAGKGVEVGLWWRGRRMRWPWEGEGEEEEGVEGLVGQEEEEEQEEEGVGEDGREEGKGGEKRRRRRRRTWWWFGVEVGSEGESKSGRLGSSIVVGDVVKGLGKTHSTTTTTTTTTTMTSNTAGGSHHQPSRSISTSGSGSTSFTTTSSSPSSTKPTTHIKPRQSKYFTPLGPSNDFSHEPWLAEYQSQSFWARALGRRGKINNNTTVPIRERALLAWQDRVVFVSVLWSGLAATLLTVASLFAPVLGLF
ncbi:hypothetical protein VTJ04DRAFT_9034 [Mycothermus thermophilus]|uniref:uncharacterized protein n=1 Tax=Humicola insolens TaxID=85995 RepID=UPI0037425FFE